jgi:anti-sigma factor RsiW
LINCRDVVNEISDYLDGVMDETVKQELRDHLKKCHKCQVIVDTTRKTIEFYCDGKLFPLPDPVRERLHQTLRRKCCGESK